MKPVKPLESREVDVLLQFSVEEEVTRLDVAVNDVEGVNSSQGQ